MPTDYKSLLNETQYEAVSTSSQYVRIIAGAGSGKTRVLTYRISYLIEVMGVDPSSILAVTFTNKAAKEMKERVAKLTPRAAAYLTVSTFHAFCARFIRKECRAIGYPVSFAIFDEEDSEAIIKEIGVSMGYKKSDKKIKLFKDFINRQKMLGKYPDDINPSSFYNDEKECLEVYEKYEEEKTKMFALDFDDLILKTIAILTHREDIRERWANCFSHILIDEYQDTNDVQHKLIDLLCTPYTSVYVVGDPDQTIYTWRGANQAIILNFPKEFQGAQDIILNRNYRSTKNILDAANRLISHNKKRVPKDLYTEENEGDPVTYRKYNVDKEEAAFVASKIKEINAAEGGYQNIAVLYRSSYVTRALETEFAVKGIPYRIFGGLRFYQRMEVKDVLAYLRLMLNPLDDVSFLRIANVPKRGVGDASLDKLKAEAESLDLSCYNYMLEIEKHPDTELPSRVINSLTALMLQIEETKKKLTENLETYSGILRDFIQRIGYFEYITEQQAVDEDRVENVNALFDDINYFISNNPDSTIEEYLQNVSLLTSQDDMNGGDYVSLMTIHVAKGLEFDHVFVVAMNDGSFPNARSVNESGESGMEEERRLAYVAMTRAKKHLYLTCNTSYSFVTDGRAMESQFFKEAGFVFSRSSTSDSWNNGSTWGGSSYGRRPSWSGPNYGKSSTEDFFDDGDHLSPFEENKVEPKKEMPKLPDNGVSNWKVGDRLHHEKFGDGTVSDVVSTSIIKVKFDSGEEKQLLSGHKMISRTKSSGGDA